MPRYDATVYCPKAVKCCMLSSMAGRNADMSQVIDCDFHILGQGQNRPTAKFSMFSSYIIRMERTGSKILHILSTQNERGRQILLMSFRPSHTNFKICIQKPRKKKLKREIQNIILLVQYCFLDPRAFCA